MEAKWSKNATSVVVLRHLYKTQIKWLIIYVKMNCTNVPFRLHIFQFQLRKKGTTAHYFKACLPQYVFFYFLHVLHGPETVSIFLSDAKCGPVCRAQTCAHSGVEPSRSAKAFLQSGPKTSKKFRIFHHFETLFHISQKLLKIEAYKQRGEKSFISPLSNCRMCLDPSVTWFCRVGQK